MVEKQMTPILKKKKKYIYTMLFYIYFFCRNQIANGLFIMSKDRRILLIFILKEYGLKLEQNFSTKSITSIISQYIFSRYYKFKAREQIKNYVLIENNNQFINCHQHQKYQRQQYVCIDGTGSMSHALPKIIIIIQKAMPAIYQTILNSKIQCNFEIKLVIYRNYSSDLTKLLQYSSFELESKPLTDWLGKIKVSGGQGNQAVQVCLQHLNKLQNLNQFIIIADAPANTKAQTNTKISSRGQSTWQKTISQKPIIKIKSSLFNKSKSKPTVIILVQEIQKNSTIRQAHLQAEFQNTLKSTHQIQQKTLQIMSLKQYCQMLVIQLEEIRSKYYWRIIRMSRIVKDMYEEVRQGK